MHILGFLLQIGDLFQGKFTWRGFWLLFLFALMAFIALGFTFFVGYKVFRSRPPK